MCRVFAIKYRTVPCNAVIQNEAKLTGKLVPDPHADMKPKGLNCATQVKISSTEHCSTLLVTQTVVQSVRCCSLPRLDWALPCHAVYSLLLTIMQGLTVECICIQGALTTEASKKGRAVVPKKKVPTSSPKASAYRKAMAGAPPFGCRINKPLTSVCGCEFYDSY